MTTASDATLVKLGPTAGWRARMLAQSALGAATPPHATDPSNRLRNYSYLYKMYGLFHYSRSWIVGDKTVSSVVAIRGVVDVFRMEKVPAIVDQTRQECL